MTDRLLALRVFVRAAHSGSFSRAARDLSLSQPSASRILAQLESELGAALLMRSTRKITLTDAGADYLARVEPLLANLEEADHAVRGAGELRGVLRVALSPSFGVREVIPRLPPFLERHPALRIDLGINDARQDLVAEGVDVAFRLGALADSRATALKIASAPRVFVAAPGYLARKGRPARPGDLAEHEIIFGPGAAPSWTFAKDGRQASVRVDGRLATDSNEGATAAAVAGIGVTATSLWGCRAELERGELERLLPDWETGLVDLHAMFPVGRAASPAARAFADYLGPKLRGG